MATTDQVRLVQIARTSVKLNEQAYRVLLANVAGVESTRHLTNTAVEDVMSVLEGLGFEDRVHGPGYWGQKVVDRGRYANARMVHRLTELAAASRYPLAAMCLRFSAERTDRADRLTPREAWLLIEMYKASNQREADAGGGGGDGR